ncbi:MAG: tetratricopeptide repeat protein [Achromobacter sp.]|uniref:bifunctional class I SAM-dependent methyltransferase/glycosyltransferase n=1 Tax=Achromobacter sp. TaxID=134375 RepID=UPI0012BEEE68|nr:bifunctional class I SAM-dependent methyltransferase/glycosyltransferase [Achromobacter sp.]MPS79498.1 tetratricopeptide repeat protein [Achromobacter sp.]
MSQPVSSHRHTQVNSGRLSPSHGPSHLRATAHLYGFITTPLAHSRMLVLGCGAAEGLLPFATAYPTAQVVGIDSSAALIERGSAYVLQLKLSNVQLRCQHYATLSDDLGQFDYIIASGLYSYLDAETARTVLEYCGHHLSPLGLLYVDYHIYPGAKAQEIIRDSILLHAREAQTEAQFVSNAQAALTLFTDGLAPANPMGKSLAASARQFNAQFSAEHPEDAPNLLAASACYFIEFVDRAAQAGLSYAGDSDALSEEAISLGQGVSLSNSLLTIGQPTTVKQQYLDFATSRSFRQSIWVSASREQAVQARLDLSRMKDLRWASGLQRLAGKSSEYGVTYVNHLGQGLSTTDQAVQDVADTLAHLWPASAPYSTLLEVLMHRHDVDDATARKQLDSVLKTLLQHNVVHYILDPSPYDTARTVGSSQEVKIFSGVAQKDVPGFNLWHEPINLQLTVCQQALLHALSEGMDLAALIDIAAHAEPTLAGNLQPGSSEVSELLYLLRRYALVQSTAEGWVDLLQSGLKASQGMAPFFGLYVSAMAWRSLEAGLLHSTEADIQPAPALLAQSNKMQEYIRQNAYQQAEPIARKLTNIAPGFVDAWEVLTACLFNTGQLSEALNAALRMMQVAPADFRSHVLLGISLARMDRSSEAINACRRAVELAPRNAHAYSSLGDALNVERRYAETRAAYEEALRWDPKHRKSLLNLCKALIDSGDIVAAEQAAQVAVAAYPDAHSAHNNLLFSINYSPDKSASDVYLAYQNCDRILYQPLRGKWRPHTNSRQPGRRLKIGYVSPDFRKHSGNGFVESHFSLHDRQAFELTAYAELTSEDDVTKRFKTYFDRWVPTSKLTDADLAERIRADGIDILIDLAGHTQGNRLGAFARKPAPISITWMGYGYTTGLSAIDYILLDNITAPEGCEALFSEKIWRLRSGCPYRPNPTMGEVGKLPALTNGHVTFGTLSRSIRINHRVIRTWAAILQRVSTARLIINSGSYRDAAACNALASSFEALGVHRNRLSIGFNSPPWDVLRSIDIGLDCFPHNSGVTLVESLYMGVPYVTLAERPSVGRLGGSLLTSAGLPDWVCKTEEEYVEKAAQKAHDLTSLSIVRQSLRQNMQNSPLMDEIGFTREFELALKQMYLTWCKDQA